MPEELEPSPFELSDAEAISKIAAKIYHERMKELETENQAIRDRLDGLRNQLDSERNVRTQYEAYYRATNPTATVLAVIASILAGVLFVVEGRALHTVIAIVIAMCLVIIYRVSSFRPKQG